MRRTRRPRWLLGLTAVAAVAAIVLGALALVTRTATPGALALVAAAAFLVGAAALLHHRPPAPPAAGAGTSPAVTAPVSGPAREIDDLGDFFEHPPGSPPALTAAPPAPPRPTAAPPAVAATGSSVSGPRPATGGRSTRPVVVGLAAAAVVALGIAATVAVVGGRDPSTAGAAGASTSTSGTPAGRSGTPAPTTTAAPLTAAAAGDLADTELSPGSSGFTARLAFAGIVLEPRAVGVTVTYPRLTVSSDGSRSIAHLEAPTWNCLSPEPPADPTLAGCSQGPTEYADLPGPDLQVTREGGQLRLTGSFATYTRPNGSPATYTGRTYTLTVEADTRTPVTGSLQLGGAESSTTGDATDNQVSDRARPRTRTG